MRRPTLAALAAALVGTAACATDQLVDPAAETTLSARAAASDPTPRSISLQPIGRFAYELPLGEDETAAEINAYDEVSKRLFVINTSADNMDVLDLRDPASPVKIATISLTPFGAGPNSVAASNGIVAVAVEANVKTMPGRVVFYRATTLQVISSVEVGALPDMVTFDERGSTVLVANEGEPSGYGPGYTDPEGSVSIIDVRNVNRPTVRTADFRAFNGQEEALRAQGIRIFGPDASAAQDLEPEYITVSGDGRTAWVSLQENNALAEIDVASATVVKLIPLGYKDHSLMGNGIDASDRDDAINIRRWPVLGMYQPDGIASFTAGGQTYLITANEGDAREWPGLEEEARIGSLGAQLNTAIFSDAVCGGSCAGSARLGRLNVTTTLGVNPGTGLFDQLYAFGARSVSIWTPAGTQVWDSGEQLERLTTDLPNVEFNASNSDDTFDSRSDNKGPEPESVVVGTLGAKTFAFVALERVGGVVAYDVSTPSAPRRVAYVNTRTGDTGDRGPEGLTFIPARRSPSKQPLLIVGHETSGTTTIVQIVLE